MFKSGHPINTSKYFSLYTVKAKLLKLSHMVEEKNIYIAEGHRNAFAVIIHQVYTNRYFVILPGEHLEMFVK